VRCLRWDYYHEPVRVSAAGQQSWPHGARFAGINVGRTLLMQAKDYGADLLVMGCYGHSRLREFVLGGASEYVLRHMTVPVLMSH